MEHRMNLQSPYFEAIKRGQKDVELRLYDEKRQQVHPGDTIIFQDNETEETITKRVEALLLYRNFATLLEKIPVNRVRGLTPCTTEEMLEVMEKFYPLEKQEEYGVVGIVLSDAS